jgi:branched-chain amino acid aminotransferase
VLEICRDHGIPHQECDLSLTEVYRADEVFCTGTMGELAPVVQVDGRTIADGNPGPMTRRLSDLFRQLTATNGYPILDPSSP